MDINALMLLSAFSGFTDSMKKWFHARYDVEAIDAEVEVFMENATEDGFEDLVKNEMDRVFANFIKSE